MLCTLYFVGDCDGNFDSSCDVEEEGSDHNRERDKYEDDMLDPSVAVASLD